jgi:NADH-quinone oxidoreductase subunit L
MPVTHGCFLIACLAIAGIPPFAGFFSKEEILLAAFRSDKLIFFSGLLTSGLTAFYMFRLYFSIFWGKESQARGHSEGTISMKFPLMILASFTVLAGFVPFGHFISSDGVPLGSSVRLIFSIAPLTIAGIGILAAALLYRKENDRPARIAASFGILYRAASEKFYIDEVYVFITKKIIFNWIGRPAAWIDKHVVDGCMNALASLTSAFSFLIRSFQSGKVQLYTLYFFAGIGSLALIFIYLWK